MGFELCRFDTEVDEELICPICGGVLEAPVQAPSCEHTFCTGCIEHWLKLNPTCPIDRQPLAANQLKPAARILRNLLGRLSIACEFEGCSARIKLACLAQHARECECNPKRLVSCQNGCGLVLPKDQLGEHNCIRALRDLIEEQQAVVAELRCEHAELRLLVDDLRRELATATQQPPPSTTAVAVGAAAVVSEEVEQEAALAWARSLRLGRVTRWGGVISTPDLVLQAVVTRSLAETRCPPRLLLGLMERAHERHWPAGVASLELRQANRRQYDNYVIRRVPNKQAVLLLACENRHMPAELMLEPGIVMIFAHGVD